MKKRFCSNLQGQVDLVFDVLDDVPLYACMLACSQHAPEAQQNRYDGDESRHGEENESTSAMLCCLAILYFLACGFEMDKNDY